MGYWLRFFVPVGKKDVNCGETMWATTVLSHYGDRRDFISQIFPIYDDGDTVARHSLPDGFALGVADEGHDSDVTRLQSGGLGLYYVLAGDVAQIKIDNPHPLDAAMMAHIRALPPDWPLVPLTIY